VALVRGTFDQVFAALTQMWTHLGESTAEMDEFVVIDESSNEEAVAKLLIPSSLAGLVIGKNGDSIREMREAHGVRLQMSSRDEGLVTVERILRIRAPLNSLLSCIESVLTVFSDNRELATYVNPSTHYSKRPENFAPLRRSNGPSPSSSSSSYNNNRRLPSGVTITTRSSITIEVPEGDIGAVLGKGGAMIAEIQRASGASVVVSQREEFPTSSSHRSITIEGTEPSAQTAQLLVIRCIQQHQQSRTRRQGEMFDYQGEEN
jgi:predicted PilT family ATPase